MKAAQHNPDIGRILRQYRASLPITLKDLSSRSGVSPSHLGRIEKGERFPSAAILKKIARPLGLEESELFTLAGYMSPQSSLTEGPTPTLTGRLDPVVARLLSQEPIEVQRTVLALLTMLKNIARISD